MPVWYGVGVVMPFPEEVVEATEVVVVVIMVVVAVVIEVALLVLAVALVMVLVVALVEEFPQSQPSSGSRQ
jgi:hypothetical protein